MKSTTGTERLCPNNIPIPRSSVWPGSAPQRYSSLGISCQPHRPCTSTAWLSLCSPPATTQSLGWDNSTCYLWPWLWAIVWTQRDERLPHGKTAWVSVSALRQWSHHGLLLMSKPQGAVALPGDRIQGEQFAQETRCCTQPKKPNHRECGELLVGFSDPSYQQI